MLPLVSLVGYTNAGKSTIMNMLLEHSSPNEEEKRVLEKDMLFATLDTSIRHIDLPDGKSFLLSDTVGFVSDLPHDLVEAFHSTLEEVQYASLLIQVVDVSSVEWKASTKSWGRSETKPTVSDNRKDFPSGRSM